ncbi:TonB-dependent receptor [Komagataeibacter xylinus]|uniref:TonB-dependent receptor n=1 Tax=Komagataeibacter xylinus TaxID=28448 RepID=A0A857FQR2_KOMXY|nr:TonB-dependent receptor [Komagataeibacter xylinus]QHC36535.1 TonB-dependent receptor [Komagataeibacter xylinus]
MNISEVTGISFLLHRISPPRKSVRSYRSALLFSLSPIFLLGNSAFAAEQPPRQVSAARKTSIPANTAQENGSTGGRIAGKVENIHVHQQSHTAQLREKVQKTPSSVSILSAERLRELGVTDVRQLSNQTPNLYQPRATVGFSATNYFIRGIGELDPQGEPSVGTYVDGVYLPRNIGTMQELLDVDNVQIDRGPVGFDYGHQAEGGAVRINTLAPTNARHLSLLAGYGTYNEYRIAGMASGALVKDKVYASISFDRHARDGIDHNYTLDRQENDIDFSQARGKIRFTPNSRWDITLAFDGTVDNSSNRGYGNINNTYRYGLYSSVYPQNNYSEIGFTGNINYIINDHLSLHSTTGIRGYDNIGMYDNYGSYYAQSSQWVKYTDRSYSENLSLHGVYNKISFTTGAFFEYEDWYTNRRANTPANGFLGATASPAISANQLYTPVYSVIDQQTRNWAVYGQAEYKITPRLTATAALRFNWEDHSNSSTLNYLAHTANHEVGWAQDIATLFGTPGAAAWAYEAEAHKSWFQLLPKGTLSWQALPNLMSYVSISQGSKSGGFDYRAQTPGVPQQATSPYNPEMVTTYEIGVKTSPLPRILTFNGALFYNNFDNIQMTTYNPTTGVSERFNAGKGHSVGAEIEATAQVTRAWDIHYTASYLYSRLDEFYGRSSAATVLANNTSYNTTPRAGNALPYSPRFQMSASSNYRLPLPRVAGQLRIGADVSFQSSLFLDGNENAQTRLPDQTYVNAIATWTSPDQRWTVTGQARNLLNHRYPQTLSYFYSGGVGTGYAAAYSDPRTIYVTAQFRL